MFFLFAVAWRNLWRNSRRTLITSSAMAVAVALTMAAVAFQDGMTTLLFRVMVEQPLGHVQVRPTGKPQLDNTLHNVNAMVKQIAAHPRTIGVSPVLQTYALLGVNEAALGAQLRGLNPALDRGVSSLEAHVKSGVFLSEQPNHEALLGVGLAKDLHAKVGDELVVVGQAVDGSMANDLFHIVGVYRSGDATLDRAGAIFHLADLQALFVLPNQAHRLTLVSNEVNQIAEYADDIEQKVGSDAVTVQTWWEASPPAAEMMQMMNASSFLMLGIIFASAAFGVLNTMMMSVFERSRELGVLRALGLRRGRVVAMIVIESALLAAIASGMGLVLGGLLDAYLVIYGFDMSEAGDEGMSFAGVVFDPIIYGEVRPSSLLMIIASVFIVSIGASLIPAIGAVRVSPVDAIRTE